MAVSVRPDLGDVRRAVEGVPDPELPVVTLGMLGMVHDVQVDDAGGVAVELLPTFSGCPAQDVMGADVASAVRAVEGVTDVRVRFRFDPPWTAERISEDGREALRSFGITPPPGRRTLPVLGQPPRTCPYCGSTETEVDSAFGPTPCRSIHFCTSCRQPFEAFKDL